MNMLTATKPRRPSADLLIFLADVGVGQCVGDLFEMWLKERSGAASQHCRQHHEGGPGVEGGGGGHMTQQQLEEDRRRDKRPQQLSSGQALVVGTET